MKNKVSLTGGLIFLVVGIILFTNPDVFVKTISYVVGGVLILIGLYKVANYYIKDKNLKVVNRNEMAFGVTSIILGILFIFLAGTLELILRFVIGIYILLIGISKIFATFYTTDRGSKFYALIVVGLAFIICGIYTIVNSNLPLKILGLFMVIYGLIDIISYFIYKDDSNEVKISDDDERETKLEVKEKEEPEEKVEEVEFIEKKETKKKGKKKNS